MEYPNETLKEFNLNFSYITVDIWKAVTFVFVNAQRIFHTQPTASISRDK